MWDETEIRFAAIILAGGESRRMGQSKALLSFDGEPLLTRVVRTIGTIADPIVVVAQVGQALPPCPSARIVHDPIPNAGPLVGLVAGFEAIIESGAAPWIFVCTTDAPWVHPSVVRRLCALGEGFDAVVPAVRGREHVLTALYRPATATVARALLDSGERRASMLSRRSKTRIVSAEEILQDPDVLEGDPDLATFDNVNTPEDFARAAKRTR